MMLRIFVSYSVYLFTMSVVVAIKIMFLML